jgi:hypothetical protein
MINQDKKIEIVLFYINDNNNVVENVLGIFKTVNDYVAPADMLMMCAKSILKNMQNVKIILITNSVTNIHNGIEGVEVIITEEIRHEYIMFDLLKFRRDYIEKNIENGNNANIIFTDIDILFNKSVSEIFNDDFDVCLPATFYKNINFSERGVPINSLLSTINCGIFFIKPTLETLYFYNAWSELMLQLSTSDNLEEYGDYKNMVQKDFLKWWGEPHSLMVLLGVQLKSNNSKFTFKNTKIKIVQDDLYNYAPILSENKGRFNLDIAKESLENTYVFHMRGGRKLFMKKMAQLLKII